MMMMHGAPGAGSAPIDHSQMPMGSQPSTPVTLGEVAATAGPSVRKLAFGSVHRDDVLLHATSSFLSHRDACHTGMR